MLLSRVFKKIFKLKLVIFRDLLHFHVVKGFYNFKNITNMASTLKHSNLTSLSTTAKKVQDKSLEEQVY